MISNLCLPESECTLFTQSSIGWVSPGIQPPQKNSLVTNKKIPPKFFHLKYSIQIHWFNGPLKLRYLQCLLCLVFYLSQKIIVSLTYTGWDGAAMVPIKVVEGRLEERFLLILHHPLLALLLRIHLNLCELKCWQLSFSGYDLLFLVWLDKRCDQRQLLLEQNWPVLQTFAAIWFCPAKKLEQ